jgi:hypothetical protein
MSEVSVGGAVQKTVTDGTGIDGVAAPPTTVMKVSTVIAMPLV